MLSRPKIFISRCVVYHACMIHFKRIIAFVTVAALSLALVACANTGDSKNGGTSASALSALFPTGTVVLQDRPDRLLVQLPNGLLILTQELHTQPVVTTQAWVKTGSIFEQEHVGQGLSHFLEHLLAGGTTDKRPEGETNKILGQIGAHTNAQTGMETVRYYINTTSQHTETSIDLMSDWMLNSKITPEEYNREREVIQHEFEMGQGDPNRIMWKLTNLARYRHHPARHPTIGYIDEFLKISRDEIYNFYKRMYVPNNMVMVVVGDIDRVKAALWVATRWADAKPGKLPTISLPSESKLLGGATEASDKASIQRPRLRLSWPGTRLAGEDDFAMDLLAGVLGQGESSRLVQSIRDTEPLVTNVSAYNMSETWGEGMFIIDAEVSSPVAAVKAAILEQIDALIKGGIKPAELERAKRKTLAAIAFEGQSAEAMADRFTRDLIGMGDPDYLNWYATQIQAITAEQVVAAAKRHLTREQLMTLTLLPTDRGEKPPALKRPTDFKDNDPAAAKLPREIISLDNSTLVAKLRTAMAKAGAVSNKQIVVDPINFHELPNGVRVIVQRTTLVPAVSIQVFQKGGVLSDEKLKEGYANAAAMMLLKGTSTRSNKQIHELIESMGAQIESQCANNSSFLKAECLATDFGPMMELIGDVIVNPSFPEAEWAKFQPRLLAAIARQTDSWDGELRKRFRTILFGEDPNGRYHAWSQGPLGRADVIKAAKAANLADFYRKHIAASNTIVAIFGNIDESTALAAAQRAFGSLPKDAAVKLELVNPVTPPEPSVTAYQTDKQLAAVSIGFGPGVTRADKDVPALAVMTRVISTFPNGWLEEQLRGKGPGLVYSVGAGNSTGLVTGYFGVSFNTGTATITESLKRSLEVIRRARETTVDAEALQRAKAGVIAEEVFEKQSNDARAMEAALNSLYGLPADEAERYVKAVENVTPADIQRVAKAHLNNPTVVILSNDKVDEAAAKKLVEDFAKAK